LAHEILFLSRANIEATDFTMREVISAVEQAFKEKGEGRAEMPPKPGIHPAPDAFIHAMPAYLPGLHAAGIKWVSGYPENYKRGLPYISGLVVLNEPETGLPLAILDGAWITAKRTGAVTAVAAKHLARKDSKTVGILGLGVQGRSNLEALTEVLPNLQVVKTYDASTRNQEKYVEEMTLLTKLTIQSAKTPREAVADCDIIVTAGPIRKDPEPAIEGEWLKEGVLACPVDFDSYWKPAAMHSMNKFLTDDIEQLLYYRSLGYFKDIPRTYANLEEIVLGRKPGRENDHERIMSMNLGLAIEDIAVAARLVERAKRTGSGEWLNL
jgi:ornithine cyclodeaminase/alanine dehydrogenase-like protein (mu-crystallin family)